MRENAARGKGRKLESERESEKRRRNVQIKSITIKLVVAVWIAIAYILRRIEHNVDKNATPHKTWISKILNLVSGMHTQLQHLKCNSRKKHAHTHTHNNNITLKSLYYKFAAFTRVVRVCTLLFCNYKYFGCVYGRICNESTSTSTRIVLSDNRTCHLFSHSSRANWIADEPIHFTTIHKIQILQLVRKIWWFG